MVTEIHRCLKTFFLLAAFLVVVLDQLLKLAVESFRPEGRLIRFVPNTGAGFGILEGYVFWLGLLSLAVAVAVAANYHQLPEEKFPQVLWGLFLGGVVGNLIDRLFRGYVVDFIDFGFWPAFNLADSAITVSVIGLVAYYWRR